MCLAFQFHSRITPVPQKEGKVHRKLQDIMACYNKIKLSSYALYFEEAVQEYLPYTFNSIRYHT